MRISDWSSDVCSSDLRELAAFDEHGEGNDVAPAGVVGDHQFDVIAALRERKVADIVGAGLEPHRSYHAPVDDRLDRRVAIEREGAPAARRDATLRGEQGIAARQAEPGQVHRTLEPAGL